MQDISQTKARSIIRGIFAQAKTMQLEDICVVVLDRGGHVKASERADGAAPGLYEVAHGKAYGAIMLGMAGKAQMARAEEQGYVMTAINGALGGRVVPVLGGVLVYSKQGNLIGSVGVSGASAENDAKVAVEGIESVGLSAEA